MKSAVKSEGWQVNDQIDSSLNPRGLAGIHERAATIGGLVKIESAPGQGTELSILVVQEAERGDDH